MYYKAVYLFILIVIQALFNRFLIFERIVLSHQGKEKNTDKHIFHLTFKYDIIQ